MILSSLSTGCHSFLKISKMPGPALFAAITAAAVTAAAVTFSALIDANPTLFLYANVLSDRTLTRHWTGKNVLLVGASSGIGAELALLLAESGANLVLTGRDKKRLNDVVDRCRRSTAHDQQHITPISLDVTAPERALNRAIDTSARALPGGNIDVLILNAGQGQLLPAVQTTFDTTKRLMDTNFHGPVCLAKLIIERNKWIERQSGHIVVTSSILGKIGGPLSSSYTAAKHAVQGYFSTLRAENAQWLRVDLPCPGPIDTPFGERSATERKSKRRQKNRDEKSPEAGSYRSKMPPHRCAKLILAAMTGPQMLFYETLIMRQPTLGFAYLAQHLPTLAAAALNKMGPLRLRVWKAGLPLYDPSSFRKVAQISGKEKISG